ncbi:transcriptional regulator domain-containing protein [Sphingomonas oryzagri]
MGQPSNWRSPGYADDYAEHDFADFAQEFLRRNPEYQTDHASVVEKGDPARDGPAGSAMASSAIADKWGLLFRLRSPGRPAHLSRTLATRCGARGPHLDAGIVAAVRSAALARPSPAPFALAAVA